MRLINSLADRVLGVVAPKTTAGACIPPDPYTRYCSCTSHTVKVKNCNNNCAGVVFCGSCYSTDIEC